MPPLRPRACAAALALIVLVTAACAGDGPTTVTSATPRALLAPAAARAGTTLLQCEPAASAQSVTSVIGPLGGVLAIGNTRVVIPELAVTRPTDFTLTIPASRFVEISVRAGSAEHYLFERPVLVSIDYGRCASRLTTLAPVSVWHVDEGTRALLERMLSLDLRLAHTVTFQTGHLSGYAVAD